MDLPVYILLAAFNGEKYIEQQLDSIISQSYSNWRLLIRDDGSTDATVIIINRYLEKDSRIQIVDKSATEKGKGACHNFAALLTVAVSHGASMIMFCDQDDYWFSNKVELMRSTMNSSGSAMVYCKFLYADEHLNQLSETIQKARSPFMFPYFKSVIVQNHVYGCTMMITGELAKACLPIPESAENHDYWITLVASGIGIKIHHLDQPLMLYRQHSSNVTGNVTDHNMSSRIKRLLFSFDELKKVQRKKTTMLLALQEHLRKDLTKDNYELLAGFNHALQKSRFDIVIYCIRKGIKRQSLFSTLVFFTVLFNLKLSKYPGR